MSARPVQQSAFAEYPDRNVGAVLGSVQTGTNADLIAKVAPLYLNGRVLDCTYGRGGWWTRFCPDDLTAHDLDPAKGDGVDFRDLPHVADEFDAVCFDPPYVPAGGQRQSVVLAGEADFRDRFGLAPRTRVEVVELFRDGVAECARVVKPTGFVLAKCSDYVSGGKFWLGHVDMLDAAAAAGLRCWDLIVHHTGSGPGGHNITEVLRGRRHHSYLLVFRSAT